MNHLTFRYKVYNLRPVSGTADTNRLQLQYGTSVLKDCQSNSSFYWKSCRRVRNTEFPNLNVHYTYNSSFWQNAWGDLTKACLRVMISFLYSNFKRTENWQAGVNIDCLNPASFCSENIQMPERLQEENHS